jgi:FolB domain-containing protein
MKIRIKNLRARTIISINEWEREQKQEIIINIEITFDGSKAVETDKIDNTVNYKRIKKRVLEATESANFFLLEKLADHILQMVMEDQKIRKAVVEIDKPHALRFADSVSVIHEAQRQ